MAARLVRAMQIQRLEGSGSPEWGLMYFLSDCSELYGSQGWCCGLRESVATVDYANVGGLRQLQKVAEGGFLIPQLR
jgi:hypothetical protein